MHEDIRSKPPFLHHSSLPFLLTSSPKPTSAPEQPHNAVPTAPPTPSHPLRGDAATAPHRTRRRLKRKRRKRKKRSSFGLEMSSGGKEEDTSTWGWGWGWRGVVVGAVVLSSTVAAVWWMKRSWFKQQKRRVVKFSLQKQLNGQIAEAPVAPLQSGVARIDKTDWELVAREEETEKSRTLGIKLWKEIQSRGFVVIELVLDMCHTVAHFMSLDKKQKSLVRAGRSTGESLLSQRRRLLTRFRLPGG